LKFVEVNLFLQEFKQGSNMNNTS